MRKLIKILNTSSLFPIIGLVVLLLFSPCKVRNFIQVELNLPLTEVSNKSQTTTSNLSCYSSVITDISLLQTIPSVKVFPVFINGFFNTSFQFIQVFHNKIRTDYQKKRHVTSSVPLYILFKNFKGHL